MTVTWCRDGRQLGIREGTSAGLVQGCAVGSEVGAYAGFAAACRTLAARGEGSNSLALSARADRALTSLENALAAFPLWDAQDEGLQNTLDTLRVRFRALGSALGLPISSLAKVQLPPSAQSESDMF